MWGERFWGRYWANRYWGKNGAGPTPVPGFRMKIVGKMLIRSH